MFLGKRYPIHLIGQKNLFLLDPLQRNSYALSSISVNVDILCFFFDLRFLKQSVQMYPRPTPVNGKETGADKQDYRSQRGVLEYLIVTER